MNTRIWEISSGFPGVLELPLWVRHRSGLGRKAGPQWEAVPRGPRGERSCVPPIWLLGLPRPFLTSTARSAQCHPSRPPSWENLRTKGAHDACPQPWHLPFPQDSRAAPGSLRSLASPSCGNVRVKRRCLGSVLALILLGCSWVFESFQTPERCNRSSRTPMRQSRQL